MRSFLSRRVATAILAAAVAVVVIPSSAALAGPYLGLGIGTAPTLGEGMQGFAPTSRSGRLELGQRFGALAIEGGVGAFQLTGARASQYDAISLSAGARVFFNLQGPLDAFARGGVERNWLNTDGAMADYRGDGYYVGGGAELRLALPLGSTSIWIDYTRHQATLESGAKQLDASTGMWTVGLSVGL
jgi:Outer membrane protein beta-barrel domain